LQTFHIDQIDLDFTPTIISIINTQIIQKMNNYLQNNMVLKVNKIKKNFGKIKAIDDLSFEVKSGEVFGLLGPNGAGKSTTLGIITGLIRPDKGSVEIFGCDIGKNFIKAIRNLGISVENPSFYDYLSGIDNLNLFNRTKKVKKTDIYEALEKVELIKQANQKAKSYSLGMRRRLSIASALLSNPKMLILDEPTNGLDPKGAKTILDLISNLAKTEEISVLISSNLLHDIETICDRVLLIDNGKMIFCELVSKLLKPKEDVLIIDVIPINDAFSAIKQLRGVNQVEILNSNSLKVVLTSINSAKLNRYLVEKGYDVLRILPVKRTLQEIFLELKA